jgi:hypothetical protein
MSKEKRERAIAQNGNEGTHYTMTAEELQMLTETFTNDYVQQDVAKLRKETPIFSGVLKYFPDAIAEVAKCSFVGQQQHNPDKPLAWDRSKSGDELDAMMRHLIDHAKGIEFDDDGTRHIVKCGWRILAYIQKTVEEESVNKL